MTIIAVVQSGTVLKDTEQTLTKLDHFAGECAQKGAKLAVFPEAFIGGYPKGMDFGAFGVRGSEGRRRYHAYADTAIKVPGSVTQAIGQIAQQYELCLVVGIIEREVSTLYNTVLYIGPDGKLLGRHRSLALSPEERSMWHAGDGSTLSVIESPLGNIGALIRWENYMPYARMVMYAQQVELYCAPTVDDSETWIPTLQHIAREGGCFVFGSCQYLTRNDYPADWLASAGDLPETVIRGGSCIVNPLGEIIAGPLYHQERILIAEFNPDTIVEG